ncbi:MAG: hypothetical protein HY552_03120 [Elusimicrobia bacterium]|nr:hypothetical protein [Elusimicrobiota bacterium]
MCYRKGMEGGDLFVRFVITAALGLAGLGMVLTTLFDGVLADWDLPRDLRQWWRRFSLLPHPGGSVRAEDILLEIELSQREGRYQRPPAASLDRRREALRDLREAEVRLSEPVPAAAQA